ncbi:putative DNA-binding domain-containing protein [Sinorhizobium numidicum]|uniref:DNA-binding domain-containing protein n=1 Tax=Sinorhizobium numidicum TaxID=680248 RepID=A0ABY8CN39_9HYPH|nr:DNA-binding domain-containing protein [Sinorhizobium numidicum]WEX74089.1 putative DNA-binding domain-containing protein [Sinorhizobium numidicum]WEX80074.1 putative DNA-binding domain-containing protein [Sinorhizobium numidicum]
MSSIESLQSVVARAVITAEPVDILPLLARGRFDPARRLNIYRNNTRASLTATLKAVFPVTVQLLDERYFSFVASCFIRSHPPSEPRLARYGAGFAAFLARFEETATMPFVAETARLEWHIAEALDAPLKRSSTLIEAYEGLSSGSLELTLQPSLRLLLCRWPALSVWTAHQQGADPDKLLALRRGAERIALWRHGDAVRFMRIDAAEFAFRYELMRGRSLEAAVSRACRRSPDFDLARALTSLFVNGLVTGIHRMKDRSNQEKMS